MKNNFFNTIPILLAAALILTGCNSSGDSKDSGSSKPAVNSTSKAPENTNSSPIGNTGNSNSAENNISSSQTDPAKTLQVSFGADGAPFTMHIYDNPTAAAIARHVGTARWQLPIYHYDDYENWEVMQYYDIPSRYEIPSAAESISSEKAGEVYYSEPNRIVLFFGDAQVNGEYSPVGYFDPTPEFISAVENNPVLEGWGNKLVIIQPSN